MQHKIFFFVRVSRWFVRRQLVEAVSRWWVCCSARVVCLCQASLSGPHGRLPPLHRCPSQSACPLDNRPLSLSHYLPMTSGYNARSRSHPNSRCASSTLPYTSIVACLSSLSLRLQSAVCVPRHRAVGLAFSFSLNAYPSHFFGPTFSDFLPKTR